MDKSLFAYSGDKERTDGISECVRSMSISAIKEISLLAAKFPDVISFSWGLPSFRTPKNIREAVIKVLKEDDRVGKYAPVPGLPELRKIIADKVKKERNWDVDPESQILVTAGAMEALVICMHTLLDQGNEVILQDPGFASYYQQIKMFGAKAVHWEMKEDFEADQWKLDIDGLKKIITSKTKLLIINSPHNPTGAVFTKEELDQIADLANKHDFYIITDNPYEFLTYDREFYSISQNENVRDRLIMIRSLSKEYAMSGWRIGYIVSDAGIVRQMLKVHDACMICAPTISQFGAIEALTGPQDRVVEFQKEFLRRRDIFCDLLEEHDDLFKVIKPKGAYYTLPMLLIEGVDSYQFALDLLEKVHVSVVPGDAFGNMGKGHVRMTFCGTEENIREGFNRIGEYKKKYLKL